MFDTFIYAGMNASLLGTWIGLLTIAGLISRKVLRTPALLGLFGDLLVGMVGLFGLGWILQQFDIDVSRMIVGSVSRNTAIWLDAGLVALAGALLIRLILKPLSELSSD